jgi:hypothetical protein
MQVAAVPAVLPVPGESISTPDTENQHKNKDVS